MSEGFGKRKTLELSPLEYPISSIQTKKLSPINLGTGAETEEKGKNICVPDIALASRALVTRRIDMDKE